jgi:hypothetical protein
MSDQEQARLRFALGILSGRLDPDGITVGDWRRIGYEPWNIPAFDAREFAEQILFVALTERDTRDKE